MTLFAILARTPVWVWGLFAALLALGLSQAVTRRVPPWRLLMLPLAMLALGLWTLGPVFLSLPLVGLLWAAALAAGAAWMQRRPPRPGVLWLAAEQRLHLPGSWLPLVLTMAIFSLRYTLGVGLALNPGWRFDPAVQAPAALLFGAISGVFLGRSLGLLRLSRHGLLPRHNRPT